MGATDNPGSTPPADYAAAGPNSVVEVVDWTVGIFNKSTGAPIAPITTLNTFFNVPPGDALDPMVVYDEIANRFFITTIELNPATQSSHLEVAISKTPNPTNLTTDFTKFAVNTRQTINGTASYADNPRIGYNADAYVVAVNMYDFQQGIYDSRQIITIDKSGTVTSQSNPNGPFFSMSPAVMHGAKPGDPMWMCTIAVGTDVQVTRMDNVLSASPNFTTTVVPVNPYNAGQNPNAPQGNGVITTTDDRMLTTEWRNNRLVSTIPASDPNSGGRTLAHWYEFNTAAAAPTLTQEGAVDPGPGIWTYFPSIAIAANGDIGMNFMESSAGTFISMAVTGRSVSDPPGTMQTPVVVKAGEKQYSDPAGSPYFAGPYSNVMVDPSDGTTFWAVNEYASTAGSPNWGTWIGSFQVAAGLISGAAYNDLNANGVFDAGDTPLPGRTVFLDLNGNGSPDPGEPTATTDASGNYKFNVAAGTYTVREALPANTVLTQPSGSGYTVTVSGTQQATGKDFGTFALRTITGTVFDDRNGSGTFNPGEPGLPGRTVRLFNAATNAPVTDSFGQPVTATTDGSGVYTFTGLSFLPGNAAYRVREAVPAGWLPTTPAPADVPSAGPPSNASPSFGDFQLTSVSGSVFNDLGGDGQLGAGDPGLAGWTIRLLNASTGLPVLDAASQPVTAATDAGGNFAFANLGPLQVPGNGVAYRLRVTPPSGAWLQSSADPTDITLQSGTPSAGVDFGFFHTATLTGTVFDDRNGSGTPDPGDAGLPGVTVNLIDPTSGTVLATTTTDPAGHYTFANRAPLQLPGNGVPYRVQAVVGPVGVATSAATAPATLTSGGTVTTDFGVFRPASISGQIYEDRGGLGKPAPGDPGLAGWTVQLLNAATGQPVTDPTTGTPATAATDPAGHFSFAGLVPLQLPGNGVPYRVRAVPPAGWAPSSAAPADVSLSSGTPAGGIDVGEFRLTSVSGRVFNDRNGDGLPAAGEPGLGGVTVRLRNAATGAVLAAAGTDAAGDFTFAGLGPITTPAGPVPYALDVAPPAGVFQTTAPSPAVFLTSGTPVGGVQIGAFLGVAIAGRVFDDVNGDGAAAPGEPGLAGQAVQAVNAATGAVVAATTTDAAGHYQFAGLPALPAGAPYQVRLAAAPGLLPTTAAPAPVPSSSGSAASGEDLGLFRRLAVGGRVFQDKNGNGSPDPGEGGLAGWTVELLDAAAGAVLATTVTDAAGGYGFAGLGPLPAGSAYVARAVAPAGWVTTSAPVAVPAVSGGDNPSVDLGAFRLVSVSGDVFADRNRDGLLGPGDRGLRSILVQLFGPAGQLVANTVTDAAGRYAFTGLGPGTFVVVPAAPAELAPTTPGGQVAATAGDADAPGLDFGFAPPTLLAVGAGPGGGPQVNVFTAGGALKFSFFAYDPSFAGGVNVATGDVTGDGVPDVITGAGPTGGPQVNVYDGHTGKLLTSFFAYDPSFTGGVTVAVGDLTGGGVGEIVTGAGPGGGPNVRVFSAAGALLSSFFAYDAAFTGGVNVAAGDVNGDGKAEVVTGPAVAGGPNVRVFTAGGGLLSSFFAYDPNYAGGVTVAAGDVNGDGRAEIVTGPGDGPGTLARVFNGATGQPLGAVAAFPDPAGFTTGVRVGVADLNGDGRDDLVFGAGPGAPPRLRAVDALTGLALADRDAYDPAFLGGVAVG
jgi:hypothetical protein